MYVELFAFELAEKETVSRSQTFGFHYEIFPNVLFEREIA
jgi:hypothetical protein